ncbi:hypothetical protein [Falsirhodobacter sp. alg1]|uniref:hypothetical protein n=1 Tax=Falsirhodobacter sp. alg1 TaxID=1472418 RepID=UPI0005EF44FE|nr:hypothetical protein [Falsirhodobacter sp. alg1]
MLRLFAAMMMLGGMGPALASEWPEDEALMGFEAGSGVEHATEDAIDVADLWLRESAPRG